jgi:hypothetical protein
VAVRDEARRGYGGGDCDSMDLIPARESSLNLTRGEHETTRGGFRFYRREDDSARVLQNMPSGFCEVSDTRVSVRR